MNRSLLYIMALMLLTAGCKREVAPVVEPVPELGVAVRLGVAVTGDVVAGSRAAGVMDALSSFGEDTVAMYGIAESFEGTQSWAKADRIIDTLGAKVAGNGSIAFSGEAKYYPPSGFLSVYAVYPSGNDYVKMVENVDGTAPSAELTLKAKVSEQYDVLCGKAEKLTIAQSKTATVVFDHSLAMLRFKIYRVEEDYVVPTKTVISKITVRGVSKATLTSVTGMVYQNSTSPTDSLDFVVYDFPTGSEVIAKSASNAQEIGSAAMLFPGMASVSTITLTIDGQDYMANVPKTWSLNQGKVNTLTLQVKPFEVRLEDKWSIAPWTKGTNVDAGLENNGKMIRVSAPMINSSGGQYTGTMPVMADIEIDGDYTHKAIEIESTTGGVFKTISFNSGSLNNEPMYMTAITLYSDRDCTVPVFQGKLYGGTLSSGQRVVIDTLNGGIMKVGALSGPQLKLNISFGGMGNGTIDVPYEVATALHLKNMNNFKGRLASSNYDGTSSNGAVFSQVEDIDLGNEKWTPIGTSSGSNAFYGRFYGNHKTIKNLNASSSGDYVGLFGYVVKPTKLEAVIDGVEVISGSVSGRGNVGGVVGYCSGVAISNCSNGASVSGTATGIGGVLGYLSGAGSSLSGCANFGEVTASKTATGVGGVLGYNNQILVTNCYNAGVVRSTAAATSATGGVVGFAAGPYFVLSNSYSRTSVTLSTGSANLGGVIGSIKNAYDVLYPAFDNNYFMEGSCAKGVGSNLNTPQSANPYTEKTEAELKTMTSTLGEAWTDDDTDPFEQINSGFPILKWQKR